MRDEDDAARGSTRPRPGGPVGRLGTLLAVLGLFVVVLADQPLGAVFSALGLVLCLFDVVSPGRDLLGRRRP